MWMACPMQLHLKAHGPAVFPGLTSHGLYNSGPSAFKCGQWHSLLSLNLLPIHSVPSVGPDMVWAHGDCLSRE